MFDKKTFAAMRRSGFDVGVSKSKLAHAMLEVIAGLPDGSPLLKDAVTAHLGMLGQMSATRDLNAAWTEAKKAAAREYPDRFMLDERGVLHRNDGSVEVLDKTISSENFRRLNEEAAVQGCSVNQLVSELLRNRRRQKAEQPAGG